ncbi:hypothetical protein, partial [Burkholderia sp. MSMB1498]|uniref:hypothetical protein n=1 Tax=Burkholderia sp. MSMB1498 TaxID=1637842 RepID=UPI001E4C743A
TLVMPESHHGGPNKGDLITLKCTFRSIDPQRPSPSEVGCRHDARKGDQYGLEQIYANFWNKFMQTNGCAWFAGPYVDNLT